MGLVEFYRDGGQDHAGRSLEDVLALSDEKLENIHDYIQWLFPSVEPSRFQPQIPTLTDPDIETFRSNPAMQDNLRRSYYRILSFYGFRDTGEKVEPAENFNERAAVWLTPRNHNFMRISRILGSMRMLGLEAEAQKLFEALDNINRHPAVRQAIGNSHGFWKQRVSGPAP